MKNMAQTRFADNAAVTAGLMLVALTLQAGAPHFPNQGSAGWFRDAIAVLRGRDLPWDRLIRANVETSGYYERLLNGASESQDRSLLLRLWKGKPVARTDPYLRGGFLIYEPKPLLNLADSSEGNIVSNSRGMIDREHSVTDPPNTVRIALIGDSQTRGFGLPNPNQQRYGTLLEQRLNSSLRGDRTKHVEVLNFAVGGYRATQLYYVATEKAPIYRPDIYLFTLTSLCGAPTAGAHLAELVHEGLDPRYDFIRDVITLAGVQRSDRAGTAQLKLAPYRFSLLRETLMRLKSQTARQGATLAVVLLPAVEAPSVTAKRFEGIRELVEAAGVPVIDLLDTYDRVPDIETVRTFWSDPHPNAAGHRLIADNLYRKLRAEPAVWAVLTGQDRPSADLAQK